MKSAAELPESISTFASLNCQAKRKTQLVLRHFEAYGANIFDLAICWWAPSSRLDRLTTVHGLERYLALIEQGRSVVLVTGHILTVDLCGQYISRYQAGVSMMKPLKNRLLNWMMYRGRMRNGNLMVSREQGMRPMVRYLRQGYTGYFMPDEDFGSPASVFAPFFGHTELDGHQLVNDGTFGKCRCAANFYA